MLHEKSSLSIHLSEPVVSLRSARPESSVSRRHNDRDVTLQPAVVRGLLTLVLAKPTKVSSIELELQARATTRYAQGAGPRRIDVTEQYNIHSASAVLFKADPAHQVRQRAVFARPGEVQFIDGPTAQDKISGPGNRYWQAPSDPIHPMSCSTRRRFSSGDLAIDGNTRRQGPAPPYSSPTDKCPFRGVDPLHHSLAGSSGTPRPERLSILPQRGLTLDVPHGSPVSSDYSVRDTPFSRTSSIEELPEDEGESLDSPTTHLSGDNVAHSGLSRIVTRSPSSGRSSVRDGRGRSHSRFSFSGIVQIVDAMKERMRSWSPGPDEQEERGRPLAKGKEKATQDCTHNVRHVLPRIGAAEPLVVNSANDQSCDGWIIFPEGTYTYPIFFTIPNNSPPTMLADHGSLEWNVKAEVKRPSTFKSKMTTQEEVIVVRQLTHEESDGADGIDLQKQWEDQLSYRVQIAGCGVPIGGKIPLHLTIMPLAKIKIHNISIFLDERTQYFARAESQPRSDTIRRTTLLVIKQNSLLDWHSEPILPLMLEDPDALRKSPLYRLLGPEEDESEAASSFMGPGPWTIRHELRLPESCSVLHPSNQIKGSNIMINHTLKVTLRVEKGEGTGPAAGRKKLYDIVVHVPIQILSCRCTSEWTSLPCYDQALRSEGDSVEDTSTCPCHTRRAQAKSRRQSIHAADTLPMSPSSPTTNSSLSRISDSRCSTDSLASRTHLHERLMTGSLSERGEAPPSYNLFGAVLE